MIGTRFNFWPTNNFSQIPNTSTFIIWEALKGHTQYKTNWTPIFQFLNAATNQNSNSCVLRADQNIISFTVCSDIHDEKNNYVRSSLWYHIKDCIENKRRSAASLPKAKKKLKPSARLSNSLERSTALKLKAPADHARIESTTRDQPFPPHYSHSVIQTSLSLPLLRKNLQIQFFSDAS